MGNLTWGGKLWILKRGALFSIVSVALNSGLLETIKMTLTEGRKHDELWWWMMDDLMVGGNASWGNLNVASTKQINM